MNLLSRLPLFNKNDEAPADDDRSPEEIAADEKAQRIQFHRDHVRNGPTKFHSRSSGQQRRAVERSKKAQARKVNRNHRRRFKDGQLHTAILRGHLQGIGVLPYATEGLTATHRQRLASSTWIVKNFAPRYDKDTSDESGFHVAGEVILSDDLVPVSVQNAVDEYARRVGAPVKASA